MIVGLCSGSQIIELSQKKNKTSSHQDMRMQKHCNGATGLRVERGGVNANRSEYCGVSIVFLCVSY